MNEELQKKMMKECSGDTGTPKILAILQRIIRFALVGCVVTPENILERSHAKRKYQKAQA
jgi:hypothetical protein